MNSNQLELNNSTNCDHKWLLLYYYPDDTICYIEGVYDTYEEAMNFYTPLSLSAADEGSYETYFIVSDGGLEPNGDIIEMNQISDQKLKESYIMDIFNRMNQMDVSIDDLNDWINND